MPRFVIFLLSGLLLLIALFVLNLLAGSVDISLAEFFNWMFRGEIDNTSRQIILKSRLPSGLLAIFAGAALAVSGLLMQTFFRNPVAGPFIFGISSGASLGVAILLLAGTAIGIQLNLLSGWGSWVMILAAMGGAVFIFMLMLSLSFKVKSITVLLIIGMMLSSIIASGISILQSFSSETALQRFIFWGFGSFRNVSMGQLKVLMPVVILSIGLSYLLCKSLNAILLGEEYAKSMGLNILTFRTQVMVITAILAGSITAFAGPVAFLGLAVPHICRAFLKTSDHQKLIPACVVVGALFALLSNLLAALPGIDSTLPLNAVTSVIGAPVVIWVLFNKNYRIN